MEGANAGTLVAKLHAAGVDLRVEDGRIRGRMRSGGKPPYAVGVMMADLRDLGIVAVDFLQHEAPGDVAADADVRTGPAQEDQTIINETLDKPGAADQIQAANGTGEVHELVGMNSDEASSLIEFIREGKGELIGQFTYHKSTGRFDATVRFLEGWDS